MSDRSRTPSPADDDDNPSGATRRGVLRAAASVGALFAMSSLPEFTPAATAATAGPRTGTASLVPESEAVTLWYTKPGAEARVTEEGLPIGNGRLGALVTGHPSRDVLVLADATLWTGHANAALQSDGQFPYGTQDFGTFGMLAKAYVDIPAHTTTAVSDYRRTLGMSNGLVTATYRCAPRRSSPPHMYSFGSSSVFQIDANYGTPVAMIEMLVQSRPGRVELLPALPDAWAASGSVTGIGVRGGFAVDVTWKAGQVTGATLHGAAGRTTTVVFGDWREEVTIPSSGATSVSPPARHTVFQLVNRKTGKAIDVPGASTSAGTALIQYTPSSAVNQRFRFVPVGEGLYEILTTHGGTPLAWSIDGGSSAEGARLVQWRPEHATNQQWKVTDAGGGYVTLTCARSGKVLGPAAGTSAIEQQTPGDDTGQQWRRVGQ